MNRRLSLVCAFAACFLGAGVAQAQEKDSPQSVEVPFQVDQEMQFDITPRPDYSLLPLETTDDVKVRQTLRGYNDSVKDWRLQPSGRSYRIDEPRTPKQLDWNAQRFSDRVADSVYPGFGRIEKSYGNVTSRFDYILPRGCGVKGPGVCWRLKF
jgi:hypothetical protein